MMIIIIIINIYWYLSRPPSIKFWILPLMGTKFCPNSKWFFGGVSCKFCNFLWKKMLHWIRAITTWNVQIVQLFISTIYLRRLKKSFNFFTFFQPQLAEEKGVKFHMNCSVKEFKGQDDVLSSIVLSNDEEIPADICILGVGVTPATEFLQNSGLRLSSKNNVIVDKVCEAQEGSKWTIRVWKCND